MPITRLRRLLGRIPRRATWRRIAHLLLLRFMTKAIGHADQRAFEAARACFGVLLPLDLAGMAASGEDDRIEKPGTRHGWRFVIWGSADSVLVAVPDVSQAPVSKWSPCRRHGQCNSAGLT